MNPSDNSNNDDNNSSFNAFMNAIKSSMGSDSKVTGGVINMGDIGDFKKFMTMLCGTGNDFGSKKIDLNNILDTCACGTCDIASDDYRKQDFVIIKKNLVEILDEEGLAGVATIMDTLRAKCQNAEYGARVAIGIACAFLNYETKINEKEAVERYIIEFFKAGSAIMTTFNSEDTRIIIALIGRYAIERGYIGLWDTYTQFVLGLYANVNAESTSTTYTLNDIHFTYRVVNLRVNNLNDEIAIFRMKVYGRLTGNVDWSGVNNGVKAWCELVNTMTEFGEFETAKEKLVYLVRADPSLCRRITSALRDFFADTISKYENIGDKAEVDAATDAFNTRAIERLKAARAQLRALNNEAINVEQICRDTQ